MDTTKIFIASSSELVEDRKAFRELLSVENDRLHYKGAYLELVQWEYFLDAISETSLQDEYNKALKECQIVICLFYKKAGKYTQLEFDTALQQFKETGSPLIYIYFKSGQPGAPEPDPADRSAMDMKDFKARLSGIGHFYTVYNSMDDLKYKFLQQLDLLKNKGIIVMQDELKGETQKAVANYFWIESLRQELQDNQKVSVGNQPLNIFQQYGWLVETFLQKMNTVAGQERSLRRLSFMAEAYQASLRYLCYIQVAQIMALEDKILALIDKPTLDIVSDFIQMKGATFLDFDYTSLLVATTKALGANGFMEEIGGFVEDLTDSDCDLYDTSLYLDSQRRKLMANGIAEDETLSGLLDDYLTALVYWLRKVSFVARYRLVSIKEISLNYRLGTAKNFVHLYGELHGLYSDGGSTDEDYNTKSIKDDCTFNKSILLFKGESVSSSMENLGKPNAYVNLSPLMIDQSVYAGKPTQTPEIFYYTGYEKKEKRQYAYAQYKNELAYGGKGDIVSNKSLVVVEQNINQPKLDELYGQLKNVFEPLKSKQA